MEIRHCERNAEDFHGSETMAIVQRESKMDDIPIVELIVGRGELKGKL